MSIRLNRRRVFAMAIVAALVLPAVVFAAGAQGDWLTGGQNQDNSRNQAAETTIGAANVSTLAPAWTFLTGADTASGGDVSATPAVDGEMIYFPDSKGHLFALDAASHAVSGSKTSPRSPKIAGDALPFG